MIALALSFACGVFGSIVGVFIEVHFDLEGKYEQRKYRRHVAKERLAEARRSPLTTYMESYAEYDDDQVQRHFAFGRNQRHEHQAQSQ